MFFAYPFVFDADEEPLNRIANIRSGNPDALKFPGGQFKTDYAVTYTFEAEVVENPFTNANFPGLRLAYDFDWLITQSTRFESELIGDFNLDNTDDVRLNWYNALPIDISSVLAFVPSLRLLWRNDPALQEVPLFDSGGTEIGSVFTPLEELDSYFALSLLFKF